MDLLRVTRRSLFVLAIAALVAGCATPQESGAPVDQNQDGDLDGIPDGKSPIQGEPAADAGNASVEENGSAEMPNGSATPIQDGG